MDNIKSPNPQYLTLLAIKAVITKWQDLNINDAQAVAQIKHILIDK